MNRRILKLAIFIFSNITLFAQNPIAIINSSRTTGCAPLEITFTSLSTGSTEILWEFGNGNTSVENITSTIFYSVQSYSVKLTAFDDIGNSSTDSVLIQIKEQKPSFSFPKTACPGKVLEYNTFSSSKGPYTSEWKFGDGYSAFGNWVKHAYENTGNFTSVVRFENTNCGIILDSATIRITDTIFPRVHIHPENFGNQICIGENFPYYYDESLKIRWDFGDGYSSNDPYPKHSYSETGNYPIQIAVTNECGNTTQLDTTVRVEATLKPKAFFNSNKILYCPGEQITLTANQSSNHHYKFVFDDGYVTHGPISKRSYNSAGSYKATLIVTNLCNGSDSITGTFIVSENILPSALMHVNPKKVCPNALVNFYIPDEYKSLLWHFGDGNTSNSSNPSHNYSSIGAYPISLELTNHCNKTTIYTDTVQVSDSLKANSFFSLKQPSFSIQSVVEPLYHGSDEIATFLWDFSNGFKSTDKSPKTTYQDTGVYQIKLITTNLCNKSDSFSVVVHIDTSSSPIVDFQLLNGFNTCPGVENIFINLSSDTTNCFWDFGDGNTSSEANPLHTYQSPGNYLVKLTTFNLFGKNSYLYKIVAVTSKNIPYSQINLYPGFSACTNNPIFIQNNYSITYMNNQWNLGNGNSLSGNSQTITYENPGEYTIYLETNNECGNNLDSMSILIVDSLPAPIITCKIIADSLFFYWNQIDNATGYEVSTNGGMDWINTGLDTTFSLIYSMGTNDSISIRGIGCSGSRQSTYSCLSNSILINDEKILFSIFPNPTSSKLTYTFTGRSLYSKIILYNSLLEKVGEFNVATNKGQINLTNFSPGLYIIQLSENSNPIASQKLILLD